LLKALPVLARAAVPLAQKVKPVSATIVKNGSSLRFGTVSTERFPSRLERSDFRRTAKLGSKSVWSFPSSPVTGIFAVVRCVKDCVLIPTADSEP